MMRTIAALVMTLALATPLAAQELPVGAGQSLDMATLVRMLGPVLQSLGGAGQIGSLDSLKLNSQVGSGDIAQFSEMFKSLGFDGPMNGLLSQLGGLKNLDSSAIQKLVGSQSGSAGSLPGLIGSLPGMAGLLNAPTTAVAPEQAKAPAASALPGLATLAATAASAPAAPATVSSPTLPSVPTTIYLSTDTADGKKLPRYSNLPPASDSYRVIEQSR